MEKNLKENLNKINELGRLSKTKYGEFYDILGDIFCNEENYQDFIKEYFETNNLINSFSLVGNQFCYFNVFNLEKFDQSLITSINKFYVTISDEDYINGGYSLLASDFHNNFEGLMSGLYDHLTEKYIMTQEELQPFLKKINAIKTIKYLKNQTTKRFSINPIVDISKLNNISISQISNKYLKGKQDAFQKDYLILLERKKVLEKAYKILKIIMKIQLLGENENLKNIPEGDLEKMKTQREHILELKNKMFSAYSGSYNGVDYKKEGRKHNYVVKSNGLYKFEGVFIESYKKEIVFQDLRKSDTKNKIIKSIGDVKNELGSRGYYKEYPYKEKNTFITQILPSEFQDKQEFFEFIGKDKYSGIVKEKIKYKLK